MNTNTLQVRALNIVGEMLEHPKAHWDAEIAQRCGTDESLRSYVRLLLARADQAGDFLEQPVIRVEEQGAAHRGLPRGTVVDQYTIERFVDSGGSADVYEARRSGHDDRIALKLLRPGIVIGKAMRRFRAEIEFLERLSHPNLAAVVGAGFFENVEGPRPYFAMEFVAGEPIVAYAEHHALDISDRLALILQVCDALEHAHQRGLIHRDIKPSNVLVQERAATTIVPPNSMMVAPIVKVLDFGIAKSTDRDATFMTSMSMSSTDTSTKGWIGTLPYMSPEQVGGNAAMADTRTDVYSVGVLLYELLTGKQPYEPDRRAIPDLIQHILHQDPPPLGAILPKLRGDLEIIVAKAMSKEVTRRYASIQSLRLDIERFMANQPIEAHAPSLRYRLGKWASRNRALVAVMAIAIILVMVAVGAGLSQYTRALQAERQSESDLAALQAEARTLVEDMYKQVSSLPGSAPIRRDLAAKAVEILERIRGSRPNDLGVLLELSKSYMNLAGPLGAPGDGNLGERAAAMTMIDKAVSTSLQATRIAPRSFESYHSLAGAYLRRSNLVKTRKEKNEQYRLADAASEVACRLARPNDVEQTTLAIRQRSRCLSLCALTETDTELAKDTALRAADILRPMYQKNPADPAVAGQLGLALHYAAEVFETTEPLRALSLADEAIAVFDPIVEPEARETARRHIGQVHILAGSLVPRIGQGERLLPAMEIGLGMLEERLKEDPTNTFLASTVLGGAMITARTWDKLAADPATVHDDRVRYAAKAIIAAKRVMELYAGSVALESTETTSNADTQAEVLQILERNRTIVQTQK